MKRTLTFSEAGPIVGRSRHWVLNRIREGRLEEVEVVRGGRAVRGVLADGIRRLIRDDPVLAEELRERRLRADIMAKLGIDERELRLDEREERLLRQRGGESARTSR